jgi:SAM-dependent MidA family methyltransferase
MPVRLISGNTEKLIGLQGERFVFVEHSSPNSPFNQAALDWAHSIAANLRRGYLIAIDYGHWGDEFQRDIQVRAQHRQLDSPFDQIGHADITMHVDWTSIIRRAEADGLRLAGFADQHHFLTGVISTWPNLLQTRSSNSTALSRRVQTADADRKTKRALQTLLHPEMLGRAFQAIALAKNVDSGAPQLAGFKFAREPRAALGLKKPNQ